MPMQAPNPTVATSLPMCFMVSNIARHGTTCSRAQLNSEGDLHRYEVHDVCRCSVRELSSQVGQSVERGVRAAPRRRSS